MTNVPPEPADSGEFRSVVSKSEGSAKLKIWAVILTAYVLLLLGTGYIAFFQPAFNPAVEIDEVIEARLQDESTRQFTEDSLREEGAAFKQRRELAVQSFNIVLGAALGFLAALASQALMNHNQPNDTRRHS